MFADVLLRSPAGTVRYLCHLHDVVLPASFNSRMAGQAGIHFDLAFDAESLLLALARLVKRFAGLPPAASLLCWLTLAWSSVSPGCRPPPHLSPRRETWAKDATRWPVARPVKPCGRASTGRVRLKAHPVPQPKTRSQRVPQAADPSSTCRQERAGESKAQRSALRCAAFRF